MKNISKTRQLILTNDFLSKCKNPDNIANDMVWIDPYKEYRSTCTEITEVLDLFIKARKHMRKDLRHIKIVDFGCGIGNILTTATILFEDNDIAVRTFGIDKVIRHGCDKTVTGILDLDCNRNSDLDNMIVHSYNVNDIKIMTRQLVVWVSKIFKDNQKQSALESYLIRHYPANTVFLFPYGSSFFRDKSTHGIPALKTVTVRICTLNASIVKVLKHEY